MGYSSKDIENSIQQRLKEWTQNKELFINKFIKFIQTMQKENVLIGCEYGTYSTDNALMLNHHFNPKAIRTPSCINMHNHRFLETLIKLYSNLTESHKLQLGWDKNFETMLLNKLKKYVL